MTPGTSAEILVSIETAEPQGLKNPVPTSAGRVAGGEGRGKGAFAGFTSVYTPYLKLHPEIPLLSMRSVFTQHLSAPSISEKPEHG